MAAAAAPAGQNFKKGTAETTTYETDYSQEQRGGEKVPVISPQRLLRFAFALLCLQVIRAAKVLLDVVRAGSLPRVVLVAEDASVGSDLLDDAAHGLLLLLLAGHGRLVGRPAGRPANLGDELALGGGAGAHLGGLLELVGGEVTGLGGSLAAVEEGLDLRGEDVDVLAPRAAVLLPGGDGLGGGDGRSETGGGPLLLDVGEVAGEGTGVAAVAGDVLVTDDHHGDAVLGGALDDVLELLVGTLGTGGGGGVEEDAVDDLEAVLRAGGDDVLEDTAVGAVDTDGGVTKTSDLANVLLNLGLGLAVTSGGVGGVGDSPLVTVGLVPGASAVRRGAGLAGLGLRGSGLGGSCGRGSMVAGSLAGGSWRSSVVAGDGLLGGHWGRLGRDVGSRGGRGCLGNVSSRRRWCYRLLRG